MVSLLHTSMHRQQLGMAYRLILTNIRYPILASSVYPILYIYQLILKADRPHPRDYPQTPTDYRHTDNHLRLVIDQTVQTGEHRQHIDRRTDGLYQVHYLPASLKLHGRRQANIRISVIGIIKNQNG